MKTRLTIIFVFVILLPIPLVYAPPSPNPDWPNAPYCPGGCTFEHLKTEWTKYYDLKGSEWMEDKKQEMFTATENGTLDEWLDDSTRAHSNVRTYYFYQGEVPNHDGKFVDQVYLERSLKDIENNLKNNQLPVGGIYMNFTVFLVLFSGGIGGTIFVIRRKRK